MLSSTLTVKVESVLAVVPDVVGGDAAFADRTEAVVVETIHVVNDGVEVDCFHFLFPLLFF